MRNICMMAIVVCGIQASTAKGVQPFYDMFAEKYGPPAGPLNQEKLQTKCNICHVAGKAKKIRNDYGNAVSKYLKKADFIGEAKKFDPKSPEGKQAIGAGLDEAAKESSPSGKKFGEIIQTGELP